MGKELLRQAGAGRLSAGADEGAFMGDGGGRRRRWSCLGIVVLVLVVLAGGTVWLLRDELFHPFGDARACAGSDLKLSGVITAAGASLPADATDVHYYTQNGSAQVTFTSRRTKDFLRRAGILPEGRVLFDKKYGMPVEAVTEIPLPDGLCGSALRVPAWEYRSTAANGTAVDVVVERSTLFDEAFRGPARAVVTYTTP